MTKIENNIIPAVFGIMTGWALNAFPKIKYAVIARPSKAGDDSKVSGNATMNEGVLLVQASGGTGKGMAEGIRKAIGSAIRYAEVTGSGADTPKGKLADKYMDRAVTVQGAILKEQGISLSAWEDHLNAFILAAGPQKAKTLVSVDLTPKDSKVCRLLLTDSGNMSKFLKAFPDAVSAEKDGENEYAAGTALSVLYSAFLAGEQVREQAEKAEKLQAKAEKLTTKLAEIQAEQAKLPAVVNG